MVKVNLRQHEGFRYFVFQLEMNPDCLRFLIGVNG